MFHPSERSCFPGRTAPSESSETFGSEGSRSLDGDGKLKRRGRRSTDLVSSEAKLHRGCEPASSARCRFVSTRVESRIVGRCQSQPSHMLSSAPDNDPPERGALTKRAWRRTAQSPFYFHPLAVSRELGELARHWQRPAIYNRNRAHVVVCTQWVSTSMDSRQRPGVEGVATPYTASRVLLSAHRTPL